MRLAEVSGRARTRINSHNEWDTLREVVLGTAEDMVAGLVFPHPGPVPEELFEKADRIALQAYPEWYVEDVREDLDALAKVLTNFGTTVHRPKVGGTQGLFATPDWSARGKDLYNVRDIHLVVDDMVIQGPSPTRWRYFEPNGLEDIWYYYFEAGSRWISAPKPRLAGEYLVPYYRDGEQILAEEDVLHRQLSGGRIETFHRLLEDEILFDAAGSVRLGKDLIYLVSNTGNYKGAKWLQSVLGDGHRVHTTTAYRSSHIDSTILPLRVGLVLLNSARVRPDNAPALLEKWDKIYFKDVAPVPEEELDFQKNIRDKAYHELAEIGVDSDLNHISSPWSGLNVLSLDPDTVLVHDRQTKLIAELERYGLTVIPIRMRHCYTMLGGLHCSTLDTVRESRLESYFE